MKLFLGLSCAAVCVSLYGCHNEPSSTAGGTVGSSHAEVKTLEKDDVKVGSGDTAEVGDTVFMEYTGTLGNGVQFDTNVPADPAHPDKAPLGFLLTKDHTNVIDGWNLGIPGMKVGGERKLSIPWMLAYGKDGKPGGGIPPQADLFFDVKLIGLLKPDKASVLGEKEIKLGKGPEVKSGDWVTISYVTTLINGMQVDSSAQHPPALQFQAGTGDTGGTMNLAILGVVKGVIGMKLGGERMLICPPALASNPSVRPSEKIPADTIQRFDVKLLRVSPKKAPDMEEPK